MSGLLGFHLLLGLVIMLKTIAVALDADHMTVMQKTVQDGGGNDRVAEDFFPFAEGLIGSHDR